MLIAGLLASLRIASGAWTRLLVLTQVAVSSLGAGLCPLLLTQVSARGLGALAGLAIAGGWCLEAALGQALARTLAISGTCRVTPAEGIALLGTIQLAAIFLAAGIIAIRHAVAVDCVVAPGVLVGVDLAV